MTQLPMQSLKEGYMLPEIPKPGEWVDVGSGDLKVLLKVERAFFNLYTNHLHIVGENVHGEKFKVTLRSKPLNEKGGKEK